MRSKLLLVALLGLVVLLVTSGTTELSSNTKAGSGLVALAQAQPMPSSCFPPVDQGVLFFDAFINEPDPRWKSDTVGDDKLKWHVVDGWYTPDNRTPGDLPLQTFVGDPGWQDYNVEMDVSYNVAGTSVAPWDRPHRVIIFVRAQNRDNMVGFFFNIGRQSWFDIKKNGIWQEIFKKQEKAVGGLPTVANTHVLIQVKGNTYTAVVDDRVIAVLTDSSYSNGYVGLQAANTTSIYGLGKVYFDNFRVKALSDKTSTPVQPPPSPTLEARVSALESKVSNLQTTVGTVSARLGNLDSDLQGLASSVKALSVRVDQLEQQPPGTPVELSRRVDELERLMEDVDVKKLSSELSTMKTTVAELSSDHTKFKQELTELKRAPLPPEVRDRLGQIQQSLDALNQKVEESNRKLEGAENFARLGLLVGAAGAALALLVASGILR